MTNSLKTHLAPVTKAEIDAALQTANPVRSEGDPVTANDAARAAHILASGKIAAAQEAANHDDELRAQINGYLGSSLVHAASGVTPANLDELKAWRQTALDNHERAYAADRAKAFATVDAIVGVLAAAGMAAATGGASTPAIIGALAPLANAFMAYGNGDDGAFDNLQVPTFPTPATTS